MEIKRPSHICAGAVFEFAAIFWNLFEKFLQKASFKHALALAFKGIAFCFRTYFCTASGYINSSCGTFTVFVIGTVVGFAVNLDGLTSTAVLALFMAPWLFSRKLPQDVSSELFALSPMTLISPLEQSISSL